MSSTRCLYTQASPFNLCRRTPTTSGLCSRHTSNSNAMVTFPKSPWVRHLRVYLQRRTKVMIRTGLMDKPPNQQRYHLFIFLPFLCEIYIFLRQDGEDLVKDLVWVGLTGQSNVVLCLVEKTRTKLFRISCVGTENGWNVTSVHLDLARAVTQSSSLAGSEHVDHLVQASLQRTKHFSSALLLPTVSCYSHVQRSRPRKQRRFQTNNLPSDVMLC